MSIHSLFIVYSSLFIVYIVYISNNMYESDLACLKFLSTAIADITGN